MLDDLRNYLQMASGLTEATTAKAKDVVTGLISTGIYVANTIPAMLLGTVAGVWADRWPKRSVMVAST